MLSAYSSVLVASDYRFFRRKTKRTSGDEEVKETVDKRFEEEFFWRKKADATCTEVLCRAKRRTIMRVFRVFKEAV